METSTLVAPAETFRTPDWVQDAVFYQIFPDRFASSEVVLKPSNLESWDSPPTVRGFKGGDLLGVTDHLDYLQDLGITAIYLCPVFRSTANHRYHTHEYYVVDPILGGNSALNTLLVEAHRRAMRVVLDGVFNHTSRGFFQFNHILENGGESPYINWFRVLSWPLHPYGPGDQPPGYACWWDNRELPKFNTETQAVREFLWGVGQYWVEQGIDGWRLDVPNEINDDEFWREFRRRVKGANPEAYLVGEIWGDARRWLAGDQFDAVMNYLFTKACLGFFTDQRGLDYGTVEGTGLDPIESLDAARFVQTLESLIGMYPWPATLAQLNLLGSHDTSRFLTIARGDDSALRLATLFAMCFPGPPCVYYGDEIGMSGSGTIEARSSFPWDRSKWNEDLHSFYRAAIGLRHAHAVLRRGTYRTLWAQDGAIVFSRELGDDLAVIALNASTEPRSISVTPSGGREMSSLRLVWGEHGPWQTDGQLRDWMVPPRSGSVLAGLTTQGPINT